MITSIIVHLPQPQSFAFYFSRTQVDLSYKGPNSVTYLNQTPIFEQRVVCADLRMHTKKASCA